MKRILQIICVFCIVACGGKKQVDVAGVTPSPFVGFWECAGANDSIQNLSVRIGERGDSLLVAFYWERKNYPHISESPRKDQKGNIIPHTCIAVPRKENKAIGYIINQYFIIPSIKNIAIGSFLLTFQGESPIPSSLICRLSFSVCRWKGSFASRGRASIAATTACSTESRERRSCSRSFWGSARMSCLSEETPPWIWCTTPLRAPCFTAFATASAPGAARRRSSSSVPHPDTTAILPFVSRSESRWSP